MKVFDRFGKHLIDIEQYKDLKIEEEVNISSTMFVKVFSDLGDWFEEEGYIEIEYGNFIIKEKNLTNDGYEIVGKYNLEDLMVEFEPKIYATKQAEFMLNDLLSPLGWTINNQTTETRNRSVSGNDETVFEMVYKIINEFDYEVDFNNKTKVLTIAEELGEDKGTYFHNELNLKSLTQKSDTYDLITRLYPTGYDGLGIETINGGIPYVENKTYTDKLIVGFWNDGRYQIKERLKEEAEKRLEKFSKPLRSYEIDVLDLSSKPEYEHLSFNKGDTITIIDNNEMIREKQRIVKKEIYPEKFGEDKIQIENRPRFLNEEQDKQIEDLHTNFSLTKAQIILLQDSITSIVDNIEVTVQTVIDGMDFDSIIISDEPPEDPTLSTIWLQGDILYRWNGTEWEEIGKSTDAVFDRIVENETKIKQLEGEITETIKSSEFNDYKDGVSDRISEAESTFIRTAEGWDLKFSKSVGSNRVKNSVGYSTTTVPETLTTPEITTIDFWNVNGDVSTVQNSDLETFGSGSAFIVLGNISQIIPVEINKEYNLSYKVKTLDDSSTVRVSGLVMDILEIGNPINAEKSIYISENDGWVDVSIPFTAGATSVEIILESVYEYMMVTNIMVNEGSTPHLWTPYAQELYTTNFKSDERGFRVIRIEDGREIGYTEMTPEEFAGYYDGKKVFKMNKEVFEMTNAKVEKEIQIGEYRFVAMGNGVGIVPVVPK